MYHIHRGILYRYTYILKLDTIRSPPFTRYVVVFVTLSVVFFSANTKVGAEQGPPGGFLVIFLLDVCWDMLGDGGFNPCNKVYIHAYSTYMLLKNNI